MQLKEAWFYFLFDRDSKRIKSLCINENIQVRISNTWNTIDPIHIKNVVALKQRFFSKLLIERHNCESLYIGGISYTKAESAAYEILLVKWKDYLDHVEKFPLTESQRSAVLHDDKNMIVVAGAGTGKTSTVIAKAGYLLKAGHATADEVLLLAFTRKAAVEMEERIQDKFDYKLNVMTFNALGMKIMTEVENAKPLLSKTAEDEATLRKHLTNIVEDLLSNKSFSSKYVNFLAYGTTPYKSPFECNNLGEYINSLGSYGKYTLKGETIRSHEERNIANWLFLSGIDYEYEARYKVDTRTKQYRSYRPDFYLTKYDIYIEHFGIDRKGRTASYVPNQRYLEEMQWKRQTHRRYGTKLIETYSYEGIEETLIENLEKNLVANGVQLNPITADEAMDIIREKLKVDPLVPLVHPFLNLFKSRGETLAWLDQNVISVWRTKRTSSFLSIFKDIYVEYEKRLADRKEIDFHDMINTATGYIQGDQYKSPFKYILVDEFQDISHGRSKLIESLRNQVRDCRLFCVGDDWQSIYRFTGSDISLMTRFEKRYGQTRRVDLDRTFRFDDKMSDFSERFILQNPSQLTKHLITHRTSNFPAVTIYVRQGNDDCLSQILKEIDKDNPTGASIMLLERYNFAIPEPARRNERMHSFTKLKAEWLTTHRSKGLEADYVVLGGLSSGIYGFPSEISNDPLIELLLTEPDQYPQAEERRLFYVAITRARKHVYIIAEGGHPSSFITEILNDDKYLANRKGISETGSINCPECAEGLMVARDGTDGIFYSCSNYPHCEYTENTCTACHLGRLVPDPQRGITICSHCGDKGMLCPMCKRGILLLKNGRYGQFYGCSLWRSETHPCSYTMGSKRH